MTDRPEWVHALLCRGLTPAEYRVWSYLRWRQGVNGHAWPSQATIARDLGLTVQGVRNITRRLSAKGWLRGLNRGLSGRGHTLRYAVCAPPEKVNGGLPFEEPEKVNSGLPFTSEKVNGHIEKGSTAVDPNTIHGTLSTEERTSGRTDRITYDREAGAFVGINGQLTSWQAAYPVLDVQREILKAAAWVAANPDKSKKNWTRFIVNWLSRAEKDLANGHAKPQQRRTHRPSFTEQVSTVGEVVEV